MKLLIIDNTTDKIKRIYHYHRRVSANVDANTVKTFNEDGSALESFELITASIDYQKCPNGELEIISKFFVVIPKQKEESD